MIVTSRRERFGVALILLASFLLFNLYNALTPLFEASDELWHYPLVQYLATGHGLPIQCKDETDAARGHARRVVDTNTADEPHRPGTA